MTIDMPSESEHNYIKLYEQAVHALNKTPNNRELQHRAVLALARAGSTDFALREYTRYGLDTVRNHEDIMALGGRLSKDLYLRSKGKEALTHARDSAEKYEVAFQNTQGYYSGINAATMAYMAEMPNEIISARARSIIEALPPKDKLTPTDHYFIEATRAEALLLQGNLKQAKFHLKAAIAFDPLNYTAHATTLKQFTMILSKQSQSLDWLNSYLPPKALHYAGHIELALTESECEDLSLSIIDYLQKHDVGFGYGALAAGSDILIAEALLEHGAELNIMLPCAQDSFLENSVRPFGASWVPRYFKCLEQAHSVKIMTENAPMQASLTNRLAAQLAMGQAVLRGRNLGVSPLQLLIWDEKEAVSYTALHAQDWGNAGHKQTIIQSKGAQTNRNKIDTSQPSAPIIMRRSDHESAFHYKDISTAMEAMLKTHMPLQNVKTALHVDIPGQDSDIILQQILKGGPPNSVLMSEAFACLLGLFKNNDFNIRFAGLVHLDDTCPIRCYTLDI